MTALDEQVRCNKVPGNPLFEYHSKLLTPAAFEFMLRRELQRAIRYQNYLTLVTVEIRREWKGMRVTADDGTMQQVGMVVGREVRNTDLLGRTDNGMLGLVLVDSDSEIATQVITRVMSRTERYKFGNALSITLGAACYPTQAVDADSLKHQALSRPLISWRPS